MLRQRTFFALTPFSFGRRAWQAAAVCITAAMLTACGKSSDNDNMVITPPIVTPPTTIAAAAAPTNTRAVVVPNNNNRRVRAEIESADDQHHFRTPVSQPGMLTLTTTGVDTQIRAFTIGGVEISGTPGSLIVTITVEIARDGAIVVRVTPAPAPAASVDTGVYTLAATFAAQPGTTTPPT